MKQLFITIVFLAILVPTAFSKEAVYPRQKITLAGELLPSAPVSISVKDMEAFKKPEIVKIFDPYNKNIETNFFGFFLSDLIKAYAKPDCKILRIAAIDGYKVDIPKGELPAANLFVSYKDDKGYLTVDRMGPARIIAPVKNIVQKDVLLKIGVYWVWQIKSFEFIK